MFRVYRSSFTRDVHELDKMLRLDCELRPGMRGHHSTGDADAEAPVRQADPAWSLSAASSPRPPPPPEVSASDSSKHPLFLLPGSLPLISLNSVPSLTFPPTPS